MRWVVLAALLIAVGGGCASAPPAGPRKLILGSRVGQQRMPVPGKPFGVAFSRDGAQLFVSLGSDSEIALGRLAILAVRDGLPVVERTHPLAGAGLGIAVSSDETLLAVAHGDAGVGFYDLQRLLGGAGDPLLAVLPTGPGPNKEQGTGTIIVAFSPDDHLLLASDEWQARVSVFDVARVRDPQRRASALLGAIPAGLMPVGIIFSADGARAFFTSQLSQMESDEAHPAVCKLPMAMRPAGTLTVVDVARAAQDPANAVLAVAPAGCTPVRVALASNGAIAFVTARAENALIGLETKKLLDHPSEAQVTRIAVGEAPVGIAAARGLLIVSDSNRFRGGPGEISIVDVESRRVIATLPTGEFPRDIAISPDGGTAVVVSYNGHALEVLDLGEVGPR